MNHTIYINDTIGTFDRDLHLGIVKGRTEIPINITFTIGDKTTAELGVGMYYAFLFFDTREKFLQIFISRVAPHIFHFTCCTTFCTTFFISHVAPQIFHGTNLYATDVG